jgi:alpha-glucosidase
MKMYTSGQQRLNTSYGFDFLFADTLTPELINETLAQWGAGEGWPSWAFSNHDAPRVLTRWGGAEADAGEAKLFLALLMSLRGNVFLYQGEELGLPQAELAFADLRDPEAIANWPLNQGRDGARTPMPWSESLPHAGFSTAKPWLPIPDAHLHRAVALQNGDAGSVLSVARELTELRRSNSALRLGTFRPLDLPAPLLGFERQDGQTGARCVFNLGTGPVDCTELETGAVLFSCGAVDRAAGTLGGRSACILEIKS